MKMTEAVLLLALVCALCAWCALATEHQAKKTPDRFDPFQCYVGCVEFCVGVLQLPDARCRKACHYDLCYYGLTTAAA